MKKILFLLLVIGLHLEITAQSTGLVALKAEIKTISESPAMKPARWSFVVQEVQSGKKLINHNGQETMLPASTLKTATSAAALGILGEHFRFNTFLEYDGEINDGVLKGNLYIRGGGDPTLGSDRFGDATDKSILLAKAATVVKAKGIRKIEGDVIGDASIFEDAMIPVNWVWNDIGNYYGAGASGLSFNENTYYVYFKPSDQVGERADFLRTEPAMPEIQFVNEMTTGKRGSGDQGYIFGAPYDNLRFLRGSIPQGKDEFYIKGSIPDPAWFAAYSLKNALQHDSVMITGSVTTLRKLKLTGHAPEKGNRQLLYTHQSPKLKEIVYWLNKKSVNLYGEHLLKAMGYHDFGEGSCDAGIKAEMAWWKSKGVDTDGMHLMDGSGLSRYNGITANQLCGMLRYNTRQTWFESFYESLPIAGLASDPGTMRYMCKNTAAANNLRGKSGYISRVRAYTGYVDTQSGKRLCYAMMGNNFTCKASQMRKMFEVLMVKMAELP